MYYMIYTSNTQNSLIFINTSIIDIIYMNIIYIYIYIYIIFN